MSQQLQQLIYVAGAGEASRDTEFLRKAMDPNRGPINTFRKGDKWSKIAKPGDIIEIVHCPSLGNEDKSIRDHVAFAVVTNITVGKFSKIGWRHSGNNATMAFGVELDTEDGASDDVIFRVYEKLKSCYSDMKPETEISVLEFQVLAEGAVPLCRHLCSRPDRPGVRDPNMIPALPDQRKYGMEAD